MNNYQRYFVLVWQFNIKFRYQQAEARKIDYNAYYVLSCFGLYSGDFELVLGRGFILRFQNFRRETEGEVR